ncbi:hypothetical protein HK105_202540 [Polyrhizophydium stewartii]|uniref:RING-type domain-containing protein n=1 Tax=Polyrhizophydium stewartii TaxID=2732419 RepID=A0ABR4NDV3_9FUNG
MLGERPSPAVWTAVGARILLLAGSIIPDISRAAKFRREVLADSSASSFIMDDREMSFDSALEMLLFFLSYILNIVAYARFTDASTPPILRGALLADLVQQSSFYGVSAVVFLSATLFFSCTRPRRRTPPPGLNKRELRRVPIHIFQSNRPSCLDLPKDGAVKTEQDSDQDKTPRVSETAAPIPSHTNAAADAVVDAVVDSDADPTDDDDDDNRGAGAGSDIEQGASADTKPGWFAWLHGSAAWLAQCALRLRQLIAIPRSIIFMPDPHSSCPICIDDYRDGDEVRQLPCGHHAHKICMDRWLQVNIFCPFCKANIREDIKRRRRLAKIRVCGGSAVDAAAPQAGPTWQPGVVVQSPRRGVPTQHAGTPPRAAVPAAATPVAVA